MNRPRPAQRVLVVGDLVVDIVAVHDGPLAVGSDTAATITVRGGGSAANTAAWLAALGVGVDLVGVVGADQAGDDRLAELIAGGVACAHVRRAVGARTGSAIVLVHAAERTMLCDRGANLLLEASDVDKALAAVPDAGHLHLSGYTLLDDASRSAGQHALAAAAERQLTTSVDASSAAPLRQLGAARLLEWVRGVDLLLANLDEARALLADAEEPLTDAGSQALALANRLRRVARHAVIKIGPGGAVYAGPDSRAIVPARPVEVVDPTGAGDAFAAGLLSSWLRGEAMADAVRAGVHLGTEAVTPLGSGATPRR